MHLPGSKLISSIVMFINFPVTDVHKFAFNLAGQRVGVVFIQEGRIFALWVLSHLHLFMHF